MYIILCYGEYRQAEYYKCAATTFYRKPFPTSCRSGAHAHTAGRPSYRKFVTILGLAASLAIIGQLLLDIIFPSRDHRSDPGDVYFLVARSIRTGTGRLESFLVKRAPLHRSRSAMC